VPPTGKSIRLRSAAIFKFDQDRLVGETVYFDLATLMRQLGAA
jgi:predicted ester cyclase